MDYQDYQYLDNYDDYYQDDYDIQEDYYSDDEPQLDDYKENRKILMVAEKNTIAEAIAKALSPYDPKAKKGRQAFYYYKSTFRNAKASFIITATNGHVYNRDFPKEYADWKKTDPFELFSAETVKRPVPKTSTVKLLASVAQGCDTLILWLDNDREGENICFEVQDICLPKMNKNAQVLRAKFSSITTNELRQAYNNIQSGPNLQESLSVDARQIIDLKIGVAFSRFQTMHFNQKYPELQDRLVTYGPCQTPTLGFCVARHNEIINHKPKTYYVLKLSIQGAGGVKQTQWEGEPIWNELEARKTVEELQKLKFLQVHEARSQELTYGRPQGVNTVNLLKFCSSYLGIGPQQAMHIAERLYLSGYISYPRTESTAYPKGFNTFQIIKSLKGDANKEIVNYVNDLLASGINSAKSGIDVGDHPPIAPTGNIPKSLSGQEKGIYDYVTKMFLATHSADCRFKQHKLKIKHQNQIFSITGNEIINPGFTNIIHWLGPADSNVDFNISDYTTQDNKVQILNPSYGAELTKPPSYLSESDLITLMEKHGIGTDASMPTHINNIVQREYVTVQGSRQLVPTELGISLVGCYLKICPDLVAPNLRGNIERQCDEIAKGKIKFEQVVHEVIEIFKKKYKEFTSRINEISIQFHAKKSTLQYKQDGQSRHSNTAEAKPFTKCGNCNRYMKFYEYNNKLECENCQKVYKLPGDAKYKSSGEKYCPLDKFQLIFFQSNKTPFITSYVCPKCLTDSPIIDSSECVCNLCPEESCPYSMTNRRIGKCKECNAGDLVFEPYFNKGSQFSVSCNECWSLYQLIPAVQDVTLSNNKCKQCQNKLFNIFAKEKQKDGENTKLNEREYKDFCIFCDEELKKKLLFAKYGQEKRPLDHQKQQNSQQQQQQQRQYHGKKQQFNKKDDQKKDNFRQNRNRQKDYSPDQPRDQGIKMNDFIGEIKVKKPLKKLNKQQEQQVQKDDKEPKKNFQSKRDGGLLY